MPGELYKQEKGNFLIFCILFVSQKTKTLNYRLIIRRFSIGAGIEPRP